MVINTFKIIKINTNFYVNILNRYFNIVHFVTLNNLTTFKFNFTYKIIISISEKENTLY